MPLIGSSLDLGSIIGILTESLRPPICVDMEVTSQHVTLQDLPGMWLLSHLICWSAAMLLQGCGHCRHCRESVA